MTTRITSSLVGAALIVLVECVLRLDGGEFRIGQRVLVRFKKQG
jgi:hypothetical protein